MKTFFRGALAAGLLAIAGQAHGICTPNATGLQLDIPSFGDNFATWATCIQDDLQIINDSAASTSTLTIATTTLQAQIDDLGISTGALELSKVDRAGDAMTGPLTMLSSTITVGGSEFSVGLSTLVVIGGRVGIGITDPRGRLHIVASAGSPFEVPLFLDYIGLTAPVQRFRYAMGSPGSETIVESTSLLGNVQFFGYDGTSYVRGADMPVKVDGNPAAGDVPGKITFRTKPQSGSITERMVITSSGSVGIGTTVPFAMLHIIGSDPINLLRLDSIGGGSIARLRRANGTIGGETVVANNEFIGNMQFFGFDGAVYIRGADIAAKVDGNPASGDVPMKITFRTAPQSGSVTERMVITSNGDIGIGITSPSTALEVSGTVTATAFAGPLTGNVTGTADEADALSSDPSPCGAGEFVNDVDADGTLICSTPVGGGDMSTTGDNQMESGSLIHLLEGSSITTVGQIHLSTLTRILSASGSNTSFVGCITSTITLKTTGASSTVYVHFGSHGSTSSVGRVLQTSILLDGECADNGNTLCRLAFHETVAANRDTHFGAMGRFVGIAPGEHDICVGFSVNAAATWRIATSNSGYFYGESVK